MTHYELPIFAFLAALLVLIPLPYYWRRGNVAIFAIIAWTFAVDIVHGINATIWANNTFNAVPLWCDIVTKLITGASYALPISFMCICKHLAEISSSGIITFDSKDRRHRMVFEAVMCFGLPFVFMALYCIVQDHRFNIIEDIGCQSPVYNSIPAIFIFWFPRLLFSVITMIYAAIALHRFIRHRLIFSSHLKNSGSGLTTNQYFCLISMTLMNMIWNTILTIFNLYDSVSGSGLHPWTSWNDVHSHWNHVDVWSRNTMPLGSRRIALLLWWTVPVSSFIFFIFQYGFRQEIRGKYTRAWIWLKAGIFHSRRLSEESGTIFRGGPLLKHPKLVHQRGKGRFPIFRASAGNSVSSTINLSIEDLRHCHLHDSLDQSTAEESSTLSHVQTGERLPQLPEIPVLPPFSSYLPSSLPFTDLVECRHIQDYRRPFCGPSICAPTRPNRIEGIVVTVHRHASIDTTT
ncbi:STE3-type of pheromone receptor [Agaricus bisporus var. burnettii JB137-S8]|uniref:STE3-type of pheromone receptor n=1 Tax=Agaricus bisporus var. burnettii (strain JB137-S8 / ATCC MYA-4627 / FGSC 10392) TaxID=597362 RepID=K5VQD5_AGABU|nr:STE3-type of pheromone receptor [Agaricus bisporus var. burnettii JB137-S8]EKM76669.1 STE3-type of pheromone receptor [Agaricus bisporus var. burnettii JB137-S8]